jgi:hypothetical protein
MVVVEFEQRDYPEPEQTRKRYFIGRSIPDILADVVSFDFKRLSAPKEISIDEARSLGVQLLKDGIEAITRGSSKSFCLRRPDWKP